jgi:hypothetical protein
VLFVVSRSSQTGEIEKHVVVIGTKRRRFMCGAYLEMQANRHRQAIPRIRMVKRMCHAYQETLFKDHFKVQH